MPVVNSIMAENLHAKAKFDDKSEFAPSKEATRLRQKLQDSVVSVQDTMKHAQAPRDYSEYLEAQTKHNYQPRD